MQHPIPLAPSTLLRIENKITSVFSILSVLLLLGGCNDHEENKEKYSDIYGIWDRTGYGEVLEINKDGAKRYQYTRQTCVQEESLDNNDLETLLIDELEIASDNNSFSVIPPLFPAFRMHLDRLQQLPATCQPDQIITTPSPVQTFEHLWHNFNDYYAFFQERGVNWQQQYTTYHPLISDTMSQDALWTVLTEMLAPIDDGHIQLQSKTNHFSPDQPSQLEIELQQAFQQQNQTTDFETFATQQLTQMETITGNYLNELQQGGGPDDDVVYWGKINEQLGYLHITRMAAIASHIDLNNLDGITGRDDVAAINTLMQQIIKDLQGVKGLVIDIRLNSGGHDAVSLAIANHFTRQYQLALQKYPRTWRGNGQTVKAYLEPTKQSLHIPIAILTSDMAASAAETFLMAMRTIPDVHLVGTNSQGILSDMLSKSLPNGWEISLSNEFYYDHNGLSYEVSGLPVDIAVNPFDLSGFNAGRDTALDTAIHHLGFQLPEL